ncbi:hypothetical protein [Helicobacter canis]|uniref:hypothetical protein n=1 Tax=Helicobacter canis TaxID=29419 RepID=UPI000E0F347A|nr:hypothetical protein [Helicobacter canis]
MITQPQTPFIITRERVKQARQNERSEVSLESKRSEASLENKGYRSPLGDVSLENKVKPQLL